MATANVPQIPLRQCTGNAPTGSSIPKQVSMEHPRRNIAPAVAPTTKDVSGRNTAQPAVMATRPANTPLHVMGTSILRRTIMEIAAAPNPPATAAIAVFTPTTAATSDPPGFSIETVPQLKPYQPNNRMNVPRTMKGTLCGANCDTSASENLPSRGPAIIAPLKAPEPPVTCTTVAPAKSTNPASYNHPPGHHTHATTTG
mmetsp:Transcript_33978/g.88619  ORF Transcript_33978/g.88619 Transcript_33978/m.88619 type:complete len:200 (+) Transcript_33978:3836-4435(+)